MNEQTKIYDERKISTIWSQPDHSSVVFFIRPLMYSDSGDINDFGDAFLTVLSAHIICQD